MNSVLIFGFAISGGAQVMSNVGRWQSPSWNTPYFDNPGDSAQIMQGINYWKLSN